MDHQSSARKKLLQYEQDLKRTQSRGGPLDRSQSRQHSKFMQTILRADIQKQQSDRALRRQYSSKSHKSINRTPSSSKNLKLNDQSLSGSSIGSSSFVKYKPLALSQSNNPRYQQIKIQDQNDINSVHNQVVPQFHNDSDQVRSARQNQLLEPKKIPFQFSFLSHIVQLFIAYSLTIGILFLIRVSQFPYYQLILIFVLTLSIQPFKLSNLLLIITALPITIINAYIGLQALTYAQIFLCYFAVMIFNEKHKIKILFLLVITILFIVSFLFLPFVYKGFNNINKLYYYFFPLFMFILRNTVQLIYWIMGFSTGLFLQIPLFIIGLEYGTILSISVSDIQFWYLAVFFTLQIMNDRTHFFLNVMRTIVGFCFPTKTSSNTPVGLQRKNNHILPSQWNGFSCLHSFHLICLIYIFTQLKLSSSPFASTFELSTYTSNGQWYKPLIIWALVSVYQVMCLILKGKQKNVLLYGYTNNTWQQTAIRGVVLVIGFWFFYMGLAVGNYVTKSIFN